MTRDESRRDLLGAWALDAVSDAERADIEAYLLEDDDARAEATELTDTAVALGAATTPERPSPELRARVLDAIVGLPQLPAVERPEADAAVSAPAVEPAPQIADAPAPSKPVRVYQWTRRTAAMFALAAAVLVGLVVGGIAVRDTMLPSPDAVAISALRDAGDARTARASVDGGGSAELVWSDSQHRSAVTLDGVDATAAGKVYQLWYIDAAGKATSAGTFERGSGEQTVLLTGKLAKGDTIGMTVEPDGGSDAPTTDPVVAITTA